MVDNIEKIPLDARLLSYVIIELNISRHNIAIYPKEHPSVDRSLNRAFQFLKKLFELRSEITLAIAKDTIIIDNYHLDKKNPVFKEFALNLSKMHVAYVTYKNGVTKDELYKFHRFLLQKEDDLTVNSIKDIFKKYNLIHINIGFVDYRSFSYGKSGSVQKPQNVLLWERYIYGLLEGKLLSEEISDEVRDIPPQIFAELVNKGLEQNMKEETYDRVISTYMKSSSETAFSSQDLKRALEFINCLKPEFKKRFLSSAFKTFTKDMDSAYQSLKKMSVEEVTEFLGVINKQRIAIPQTLMNLLDRLSSVSESDVETIYLEDDLNTDDILFSEDIASLIEKDNAETLIASESPEEIQRVLDYDASGLKTSHLMEFENEFNDDLIDKKFDQVIIELMSSEILSEREYQALVNILKDQTEQLLWIGEYGLILNALKVIESNKSRNRFFEINSDALQHYNSPEFILHLIESFRILGKEKQKEISVICEYYDEKIIPYLIDALAEENLMTIRRFLMEMLKQFGDKVIPEAIQRLADDRWFVKRNMLYILGETNCREVTSPIKLCCRHENLKVSFAALKCLLNVGDSYAIEIIREYLQSKNRDRVEQSIALSGAYKIKEAVGDLVQLLQKKMITGADLNEKIPIIKALGDIGDPQAIDALRELLSNKSFFFKGILEQLKEEVYRTLKNYPYESVKDLVETGVKSRNKFIREESLRLSKTKAE